MLIGAKRTINAAQKALMNAKRIHPYQYIAGPSSIVEGVKPQVHFCVAG
jgi:hypothetical protein